MMEWDSGPTPSIQSIFERAPLAAYESKPNRFRLEWGPHYCRGRLDGSAKVLVIGQDPAADENIARRILVGDAGRRVQGFLAKLGLTRSYVMVNSFLYSVFGQFDSELKAFMDLPDVAGWRNQLLNALSNADLQVVLAFGQAAHHVVDSWPAATRFSEANCVFRLLHPTARPETAVKQNWNSQLSIIGTKLTVDADGQRDLSAYRSGSFKQKELAHVPLRDLGFGAPAWMGTGDMAKRLEAGKPLPATATRNSTILWTAIGKRG
jgi:hypothetical protein